MVSTRLQITVYVLALSLTLAGGGIAGNRAFIWDSMGGMRDIPVNPNIYSYDTYSYPVAMNDHGEVVGWGPGQYEWMWNSITSEFTSLPVFVADINNHGETIGSCAINGIWESYITGPTGTISLGKLPGDAWATADAMNNSGQVVGDSGDGSHGRPFIWDKTNGMRQLVLPEGFTQGTAWGINDLGVVAGKVTRADWTDVAVFWSSPTEVHILGDVGDGDRSEAVGINRSGQIVGRMRTANSDWHACIWDTRGGKQVLGTLPGCDSSEAAAINDAGQVAGTSEGDGISRAFIWDSVNGMRDLGDWDGGASYAADINNSGQVCGWYWQQKYLVCSIGEAKKQLYNTCVELTDAVVIGEKPGQGVFIESPNRCSGMLLVGSNFKIGQRLTIRGVMSGDEMVQYEIVSNVDGEPLAPLGVTSLCLKPKPFDPEKPLGLDMTGVLVKLAGKVTAVDAEQRVVYLDDGGAVLLDGAPARGVKVYIPEDVDLPIAQSNVTVTGAGMREFTSLAEQMKIGEQIYPPGTPVIATSIVCRITADIVTF